MTKSTLLSLAALCLAAGVSAQTAPEWGQVRLTYGIDLVREYSTL